MDKRFKKIIPSGASQPCQEECALEGEAQVAVNVRECDDSLRVVGNPVAVGQIPAGHRLLLVDGDRRITLSGNNVYYGGNLITTLADDLVGAHRVGQIVVITTLGGIVWLRRTDSGYQQVNLEDARPAITLTAKEISTLSAGMDAITFSQHYTDWPAILASSDVAALTTQLHRAWNETQQTVDAAGAFAGVLRVRVGVRLQDDTYLWLSDPVTLGSETLDDDIPVNVQCELDGTAVTGIPSSSLSRHRYRVGIDVTGGVAQEWQPMVKAVDILATTCIPPVLVNHSAQYRCIPRGGNVTRPRLEFGLPSETDGHIASQLEVSGWRVLASTTDIAALDSHQWVSDAVATSTGGGYVVVRSVEQEDRLTASEAEAIEAAGTPLYPVSSMTCNGRLYCIGIDGVLAVSEPGNPLAIARQQVITGANVRKIMPLTRAIYSSGFGRYPVVLFTDDGIYALPQTNTGSTFGEPRLLDRMVIDPENQPIEGNKDLYFCNIRGHLCQLHGSEVNILWRGTDNCQLAWDDQHSELWARQDDGTVLAVMPSGRVSKRTIQCVQLYSDNLHALAVNASGALMDLTQEEEIIAQTIEWQSHPIVMAAPREVVWQVMGDGNLSLQVRGERGISCHGFIVGSLSVTGMLGAPLPQRLVSQPLRTVRLWIRGVAESGTVILSIRLKV